MKSLIFDAGPVISMTTNNLLWVLDYLKVIFNGDFYIPQAVKGELVDKPLASKKFKFEALQVRFRIKKGVLTVIDTHQIRALAEELLDLANHTFKIRGNWIRIVQYAEMEMLASAIVLNASAVVVDERTTRLLVEDSHALASMLHKHMRGKVSINKKNLDRVLKWVKGVKILRSVELVMIAYEKGILDKYLFDDKNSKKTLIESLLWGVKLHGCAISRREIGEIIDVEIKGEDTAS